MEEDSFENPEKISKLEGYLPETMFNKLQKMKSHVRLLWAYGDYLFALPEKTTPEHLEAFDRHISEVSSQRDLGKVIDSLSPNGESLKDDTVAVIRSDLPLFYTLLGKERQGKAEGYVGIVDSYSVYLKDGRYRQRVGLRNSRLLEWNDNNRECELNRLIWGIITARKLEEFDSLIHATEDIRKRLGDEGTVIDDVFQNVHITVLHHEPTPKEIVLSKVQEPDNIEFSGIYGPKKLMRFAGNMMPRYKKFIDYIGVNNSRKEPSECFCDEEVIGAFIGNDSRPVDKIVENLMEVVEPEIGKVLEDKECDDVHFIVGKKLILDLTYEEREVSNARQLKKWVTERGMKLSDETYIEIPIWGHRMSVKLTKQLYGSIKDDLQKMGYKLVPTNRSYHLGKKVSTWLSTRNDMDTYVGEAIVFEPPLPCGHTQREASERFHDHYKKHNEAPPCDYRYVGWCASAACDRDLNSNFFTHR